MSYEQAYTMPFGELCDLIAIEQIKHEGAKLKKTKEELIAEETEKFFRLMSFR